MPWLNIIVKYIMLGTQQKCVPAQSLLNSPVCGVGALVLSCFSVSATFSRNQIGMSFSRVEEMSFNVEMFNAQESHRLRADCRAAC